MKNSAQKSDKNGYFDFRNFEAHEASPGHVWAHKRLRSHEQGSIVHLLQQSAATQRLIDQEHQDISYWLATETIADLKIVSYDRFKKARNKDSKADRAAVRCHCNALAAVFTEDQDEAMRDALALSIGVDDGSNKHSVKEFLAVVIKADTYETHRGEKADVFMYALRRLDHNDLSAEGLLRKLKSLNLPFEKVFWFARDGASAMAKLSRLFRQDLNPYAIDVWCSNHLGNLLLKGIVFGMQELTEVIEALQAAYELYKFSPKFTSMYRLILGSQYRGPQALQRVENLTRWIALVAATSVVLAVYSKLLTATIKYKRQYTAGGEEGRLQRTRLAKVIARFCDYRFVIRLLVLHRVGRFFKAFHEALEKRESDFTAIPQQIKLLRTRMIRLCDDGSLTTIRNECSIIIEKCKLIKHIRAEQRRVDAPVRLREYDEKLALEIARDSTQEIAQLFEDETEIRFPKDASKIVSALSVLDPENFPELTGRSESKADELMSQYGLEKIKILADFYGTEYEDSLVKPPISQETVYDGWEAAKEFWRANRESMPDFRSFMRKLYKKCASSESFLNSVRDIHVLMRIAEAKLGSTAENERVIRALGQVASPQRVQLSDDRIESLVKVSTEVARKFPGQPEKVLGYQDRAKKHFDRYMKIEREESRVRMQQSRQGKRSRDGSNGDDEIKDENTQESEESEEEEHVPSQAAPGKNSAGKEEPDEDEDEGADEDESSAESSEESDSEESYEASEQESEDDIEEDEEF